MLQGGVPLLVVSGDHVLVEHARGTAIGKRPGTQRIPKSVVLVGENVSASLLNHGVCRRVLNRVEQGIAEVGVVEHAVPSAENGTRVPGDIPGDGDPGTKVVEVLVEELVGLAELSIGDPLEDIRAGPE